MFCWGHSMKDCLHPSLPTYLAPAFHTTRRLHLSGFPYCTVLFHASCFIHAVSSFGMGPFPWTWKTYPLKPSSDVTTSRSLPCLSLLCIVTLGRIQAGSWVFWGWSALPPASPQQFLCTSFYIASSYYTVIPSFTPHYLQLAEYPCGQNCLLFVPCFWAWKWINAYRLNIDPFLRGGCMWQCQDALLLHFYPICKPSPVLILFEIQSSSKHCE